MKTKSANIKVLQIINRNPRGGIYRVQMDLLTTFYNDEKIKIHVALINDKNHEGEFSFGNLNIPYTEIKESKLSQIKALRKLITHFDIVHIHGPSPWIWIALLFSDVKIIFTNHGLIGTGRKLKKHEYLKRFLIKKFLKFKAHYITNVSNYALNRIIREYEVQFHKCSVIYNCSHWESTSTNFHPNSTLKIGFHGRFVGFKRIDRLLKVASIVKNSVDVKVQLLGDGDLITLYKKLAYEFNCDIEIIPYNPNPRKIIENFDIEIIPSDEEYFGLAVLEAVQSGLPTFVFKDGGGCTEIFGDKFTWFVCENEQDMAEKILSLYTPNHRTIILEQLKELQYHVSNSFSLEYFYKSYRDVYLKIADGVH